MLSCYPQPCGFKLIKMNLLFKEVFFITKGNLNIDIMPHCIETVFLNLSRVQFHQHAYAQLLRVHSQKKVDQLFLTYDLAVFLRFWDSRA